MAQAYEYKIVTNTNDATFASSVGTEDADGWDVVNLAVTASGASSPNQFLYVGLLRRRTVEVA